MPEERLQKKMSHQCPTFTPRPGGAGGGGGRGGGPPGGGRGAGNQRGNPNPNAGPQGNPAGVTWGLGFPSNPPSDPIKKIGKRDRDENPMGNLKSSSAGDTDDSAGNQPSQEDPVPCNACGGAHSAESHADHPDDFTCPFIQLNHPQANKGTDEFLATHIGKQ